MTRIAIVGPVYPYRAGVSHCTTRLAETLVDLGCSVEVVSFSRQYPALFYPGGDDRDPTLPGPRGFAPRFRLDILNPLTWIAAGASLRAERFDLVIFVWWIWVWGIPYWLIRRMVGRRSTIVHQCHNISDKEPKWWKSWVTGRVLRETDFAIVHASSEADELEERLGEAAPPIVESFLPVHELGGAIPDRQTAREKLGITTSRVALFFGHIRPFKGLDIALHAWKELEGEDALLLVAGEPWWGGEEEYRRLAEELELGSSVRFDFRFVPDDEVAWYFAASDLVLIPYRREAQSGVALTAFHFERPLVATSIGGLTEVVVDGSNGFLVEPEDPKALAEGVRRVFELDPGALDQGAAAAARRYSWERYARELLAEIPTARVDAEG